MKTLLSLLTAFVILSPGGALAQQHVVKDSVYFTMDDGIQSPKEMEEEAAYVHSVCNINKYQATYFDCECLAGAFLIEREKVGPMIPQTEIIRRLTKTSKAKCANVESIAGQAYKDCMLFAKHARQFESDNKEYCTCAANKAARDFEKKPRLNIQHIRQTKRAAMAYCRTPTNRPLVSSSAVNDDDAKTQNSQSSVPPKP